MKVSGIALIAIPILIGVVLQQALGSGWNSAEPVAAPKCAAEGKKDCFHPTCSAPEVHLAPTGHKRSGGGIEGPNQSCTHMRTNPKMASIFALLLIAFSFIVELILHRVEHLFHDKPQIMKIVQAIYNELMLLGLIAILVFVLKQSGAADKASQKMACALTIEFIDTNGKSHCTGCCPHDIEELFEKVHLGVSATMGIYFISCLYLVLLHWIIYKHWIAIDFEPFDQDLYNKTLAEHNNSTFIMRYLHIPRRMRMWRLHGIDRIHALRAACIEQYGLPQDFQFSKYFKLSMRDVVIHVLEVHPVCWAILVVALLLTFLRLSLGMRVSNSDRSIAIYGGLSAIIAALSCGIYFFAARIYRKVLALPSVKRHLKTSGGAFEDDLLPVNADPADPSHLLEDGFLDTSPTSSYGTLDAASSFRMKSAGHSSWSGIAGANGADVHVDKARDGEEHSFEDTVPGKQLHFQVFKRHGQTLALMSVDDYRVYSTRVRNILVRAQTPTTEDDEHKSMLFFRWTKFLVLALQVVTFLQTWALGLSIYFLYSVYKDVPKQPPDHPAVILFLFLGPVVTYGLMGPTLAKLVKATYTGGLVRPELILEALFQPKSRAYQPDASGKYVPAERATIRRSSTSPPTSAAASSTQGQAGNFSSAGTFGPTSPSSNPLSHRPTQSSSDSYSDLASVRMTTVETGSHANESRSAFDASSEEGSDEKAPLLATSVNSDYGH